MSLYNIDFDVDVYDNLPPDKRIDKNGDQNNMVNWAQAIIASPMQWLNDLFKDYREGTNYAAYDSGTTYDLGDRVQFNKAVYESILGSNTGNAPDITPTYWILRQPNFIGADERMRYNSTKLVYEYALNHWFGGIFRQPPLQSDIYITKNGTIIQSFVAGDTEEASAAGITTSTGFVGNTLVWGTNTDYTINIPTALYPTGGDEEVRQFADKINRVQGTYDIQTY